MSLALRSPLTYMNSHQTIRVLALLEATSISGTAKAVLAFAQEAGRGYEGVPQARVSVVNFVRGGEQLNGALAGALSAASTPVHLVRERRRFDTEVIAQLRSIIASESPDVIWTNSVKSHFLVRAGKLNRERKWVAFHHGYTTTNLKMRVYNQLDRWSLRGADRVLTVCQPFAKQMKERGVAARRIRVQHMSIRPFTIDERECEELRRRLGVREDEPVILSVGRLSHEKGHADLIRAFAVVQQREGLHRAKLILVGDGPERARLEGVAQTARVRDHVVFAGQQDKVKPFYGIADVFVLPSYTEGSPNVLLEAMAAAVPVVATKVGGIPELAQHEQNAILVKAADESELAEAVARVLKNKELGKRLITAAVEVVRQHSPESYYRTLTSCFEEALADKSSPN